MAQAALIERDGSTLHASWFGIGLLVVAIVLMAGLAGSFRVARRPRNRSALSRPDDQGYV